MADNKYEIRLGIDLDTSDLQTKINKAGDKTKPIPIKVEIENLADIKKQIQNLGGTKGSAKVAIPVDTASLESSLKDVSTAIKEIKSSIGTLDSKSGMKSLLSSINQISTALDKASSKFDELNANLNALSGKDLSLNLGINLGGSNSVARNAAYGSKVRNETLPQLKQQMSDLVKYYNSTYKESLNEFEALQKLVSGTKLNNGDFFENFLFGKDSVASRMNSGSLSSQMQAYKQYIDMFKQAASLKGLDLSSVTSSFSKSPDELIKDAQDIQTGAKEMDEGFEKLKQVFGGGNNLNIEGISTQLDSIVADLGEIKTTIQGLSSGVSLEGLTQSFDRLSETLEQLMTNAKLVQDVLGTKSVDSGMSNQAKAAQETAKAYQEVANEAKKLDNVSIDISNGNIDDLKNALRNLKVDDSSIENATKELNEMNIVAKNVSGTLRNGNLVKWDIKGVQTTADGLERVVTITKTLGQEGWNSSSKYSQSLDKIAAAAKNVQAKLENTGFDGFKAEVQRAHAEADKLKTSSEGLQTALKQLDAAMDEVSAANQANDTKRLVGANEEYEKVLKQVYSQLKLNQQLEKDAYNTERLNKAKQSLSLEMNNWLKNNSAAAKQFGGEIQKLQAKLNACDDVQFDGIKREFNILKQQAKEAGKAGQTFIDGIKTQFSKYSQYFSVASLFMYVEQGLRDMFEQVKLIDSAMTELKKVTDETDASYNAFLSNAASKAKEIGTTIDGLVNSTADFARLGYGFKDAQELAEVANIYAVVGDEIDSVDTATKSLISTMTAFGIEASSSMSIVDKFNEIGNNFAISSGGIGEALERSASSMAAANNTLDETIALITAANTVVQDADSVGTAFKTISMRIRGAKTELQDAGLDAEGMASSTAKLREEIKALSGVDIMLDSTTFKSTYKIMEELAAKWEDLTDIQQASITELIAGKVFCQNVQKCA